MKLLIISLERENTELKDKLNQSNETNSSIDKMSEIKQQIANEFKQLQIKNDEIESKIATLNLRETDIYKKETEVKQLITNYDYLFKSSQLQLEVSNSDNKSSYIWSMDTIDNVSGIKLMSYSLPIPRFNIETNKNNILEFKVNDSIYKIDVPTGKYTIDELIFKLNTKIESIESINSNIKLSINNEQFIVMTSSEPTDQIEIILTELSKNNLGFITPLYLDDNKNTIIANKLWDLRIEDKVYLYLNNLSDEIPFGILYFNGNSICQFKFEKPFNLSELEIVFKDSKGNLYNFYNLPHSLSFLVDKLKV